MGSNSLTHSFGSEIVENYVKIRVHRTLDWLASISVAKIIGQKPSFGPDY